MARKYSVEYFIDYLQEMFWDFTFMNKREAKRCWKSIKTIAKKCGFILDNEYMEKEIEEQDYPIN